MKTRNQIERKIIRLTNRAEKLDQQTYVDPWKSFRCKVQIEELEWVLSTPHTPIPREVAAQMLLVWFRSQNTEHVDDEKFGNVYYAITGQRPLWYDWDPFYRDHGFVSLKKRYRDAYVGLTKTHQDVIPQGETK